MVVEIEMPLVRKSSMDLEEFNTTKIIKSLMKEAGLDESTAKKVTDRVVRRIYGSNIQWLAGPQIREMCCSVLAEMDLLEARKRYTRLGIPLMDYHKLLHEGIKENSNQYVNAESIHAWTADRISEQYALLYLLPDHLSRAHLNADLHIHKLKYYDLRPFCQNHDVRMILWCGLPPGGSKHSASSGPAKHPMVAVLHLAKWLGIVQGSYQGGQGYDKFTAFLAPIIAGLTYKEILQLIQCFMFESNQIYAARGGQVPFTSMHCSPEIPKMIANLPAVGLDKKIVGTYGDYQDECKMLFNAICEVEMARDSEGKIFNFPKHEVELRREWLTKHEDSYRLVFEEACQTSTPYFTLYPDWMPEDVHTQCCRLIMTPEGMKHFCKNPEKFEWDKSYMNFGSLQTVSLNLPRLAYRADGDDALLYEYCNEQLDYAREILLIKKGITEQISVRDPFLGKIIDFPRGDPQTIFDMERGSLTLGHVGLNEMVKAHIGLELHEGRYPMEFAMKFMKHIMKRLDEFSVEHQYSFTAWEQPAESVAGRFAKFDKRRFPSATVNGNGKSVYYTNSNHLRYDANIPLFDRIDLQAQFHPIIQGGAITHVWLGEKPEPEALFNFTKRIMNQTPTAYLAYTQDYSQCEVCKRFMAGRIETCQCGSRNIEWWSRVTGYYSRVKRFSNNKRQEWKDRRLSSI
jgi:ribonucleoside-triphosphate reductase